MKEDPTYKWVDTLGDTELVNDSGYVIMEADFMYTGVDWTKSKDAQIILDALNEYFKRSDK